MTTTPLRSKFAAVAVNVGTTDVIAGTPPAADWLKKTLMVSIRASEIAETPRRGDEIRLDGTAWRVESSDPDSRGLTFRLALARI